MRWALALALAAVVAVVVALVLAVASTRDPVPEQLRSCVSDGGAGLVRSPADFGAAFRSDVGAGTVREVTRVRLGEDTAVLLQGTRYRVLVLAGRKSPSLGGDLPRRVYERAPAFALVAKETDPVRGVLRGCLRLLAE